ncbi:DUF2604 domain-containing protein [Bradyrhizobium sp. UFLA05-153]
MHDHGNKDAQRLEREAKALERELGNGDHGHDDGHDHGGDHDQHGEVVKITMVVNGQPVTIEATQQEQLSDVRQRALTETQNLAQPPENWEIKNEAGTVLDPDKRVAHYHFGKEVTLFLSLKAGAAGGAAGR